MLITGSLGLRTRQQYTCTSKCSSLLSVRLTLGKEGLTGPEIPVLSGLDRRQTCLGRQSARLQTHILLWLLRFIGSAILRSVTGAT